MMSMDHYHQTPVRHQSYSGERSFTAGWEGAKSSPTTTPRRNHRNASEPSAYRVLARPPSAPSGVRSPTTRGKEEDGSSERRKRLGSHSSSGGGDERGGSGPATGRSRRNTHSLSEESENLARQTRKVQKKKLKRLRRFMSVFMGGLRHTSRQDQSSAAVGKRERGGSISSSRGGGAGTHQHHHRREGSRDSAGANGSSTSPVSCDNTIRPCGQSNNNINSEGGGAGPGSASTMTRATRGASSSCSSGGTTSSATVPGLCGLFNHGNTCFMSAIIQCLSNTDKLAEYFVSGQYLSAVQSNKAASNAKKFGTSGDVTQNLALLLKCLWKGQYDPVVTAKFKQVVGKYSEQYRGHNQHDAQEFFLWLLDSVHEDLNQAGKRKYRPIKDKLGRSDEEIAKETLAIHLKNNKSFVQHLFQGLFHSVVVCPSCHSHSSAFDPYICISLPLPQRHTRPIYVTVIFRSSNRKNKLYGVKVSMDGSVKDLRNGLAELCGVNRHHLVLAELRMDGFSRTFYDDQHLTAIQDRDPVYAFEAPPYRGDNPEAHTPSNPSGSKELLLIILVNKFGQTHYGKRFGPPLILRIWRDLTHSQFQSVVLKSLASFLREGVHLPEICRSVLFRCRVVDGYPGRSILAVESDHPFYSSSVDKALQVSMLYGGPAHIKVVAEWEPETKASTFGVVPDEAPEPHESMMEQRQLHNRHLEASLDECLRMYTQEETLSREDLWLCPVCKKQQQSATKSISLWTLPDVLVLHLKRFRQVGLFRGKLNTLIQFPITSLDMSQYLARRDRPRSCSAMGHRETRWSIRYRKMKTTPASSTKSVHFDEGSSKHRNRTASISTSTGGGGRFHFWKRRSHRSLKDAGSSGDAVCDSPASTRSAPFTSVVDTSSHVQGGTAGKAPWGSPAHHHQHQHQPPPHGGQGNENFSPLNAFDRNNTPDFDNVPSMENMYDLYAVCNHLGGMSSGHYTAFCLNPADRNWYSFDDTHTHMIREENIVTPGAYMLFYVRRSLMTSASLTSSQSSSTSSTGSYSHWIHNVPKFSLDLSSFDESLIAEGNDLRSHGTSTSSNNNNNNTALPMMGGVSPTSTAVGSDDVFLQNAGTSTLTRQHQYHHHHHQGGAGQGLLPSTPRSSSSYNPLSPSPRPYAPPPQYSAATGRGGGGGVAGSAGSPVHSATALQSTRSSGPAVAAAPVGPGWHQSLRLERMKHASMDDSTIPISPTHGNGSGFISSAQLRRGGSFHGSAFHTLQRTSHHGGHYQQHYPPSPRRHPPLDYWRGAGRGGNTHPNLLPSRSIPNISQSDDIVPQDGLMGMPSSSQFRKRVSSCSSKEHATTTAANSSAGIGPQGLSRSMYFTAPRPGPESCV